MRAARGPVQIPPATGPGAKTAGGGEGCKLLPVSARCRVAGTIPGSEGDPAALCSLPRRSPAVQSDEHRPALARTHAGTRLKAAAVLSVVASVVVLLSVVVQVNVQSVVQWCVQGVVNVTLPRVVPPVVTMPFQPCLWLSSVSFHDLPGRPLPLDLAGCYPNCYLGPSVTQVLPSFRQVRNRVFAEENTLSQLV